MEDKRLFGQVFEDFPLASYPPALAHMLVKKVLMVQRKQELIIYMEGTEILPKKIINKVAYEIRQKYFMQRKIFVRIEDSYVLPASYPTAGLYEDYRDSILVHARELGQVEYSLLYGSRHEFDGEELHLIMNDSFIARDRERVLEDFIRDLFLKRFDREISVRITFAREEENSVRKNTRHMLRHEVEEVIQRLDDSGKPDRDGKAEKKGKNGAGYNSSFYEERARRQQFARRRPSRDPDVIYGRDCEGEVVPISDLIGEIGQVVIRGKIIQIDLQRIKRERTIVTFVITDFTDSIKGKIFMADDRLEDFLIGFEKGSFYLIKGTPRMDSFERDLTISSIAGIKPIPDFRRKRMDKNLEKRVELHLHTVMSDMDSVVDIAGAIETAKEWGHKAVAITDHGVLQAFPIANHCVRPDDPFKVIYGVEGYFVNDIRKLVQGEKGQTLKGDYVVFDLETTGFSPLHDEIIEIGAVKVSNGEITDHYSVFVNPERPIPARITDLTSINDSMVAGAKTIREILPEFLDFCKDASLVAHNADFDVSFIEAKADRMGIETDFTVLDTVQMARVLLKDLNKFKLNTVCKYLGISQKHHHRAVDDARVTAEVFLRFLEMLHDQGVFTLAQLNELGASSPELIRKAPTYHGIILVQNETGRVNLNRLVSASHLDYYNRRPRIPESLIEKYREGLLIGSACEAGELFQAVIRGKSEEEIGRIVRFYDYLEIQPVGNNEFMLESDRYDAKTIEDLRDYNRKIVELGRRYGKPVAATCDVHFLEPEDELYRRILMAGKGFADADRQAPLFFRTTEEMLEEFEYLGEETAREVVITNTNLIADRIEKISPIHPDKCPPVIPNSDQTLRKICYDRAHEIYGPDLPPIVLERLERELNSIITNQFAVMYIIAQKLVWDSNEHGYLVGSRGSVGSSFVATMSGITEVNPLSAHYICPSCHFTDFDSDYVKPYKMKGMSGCDMPERDCPVCGCRLIKEGHDIPFETFLGFKGNKEPDIDLNFSGEYQAQAHKYVEVIFGKGNAFRAGTITTMAEKTAYGYVCKYFEERGITKRQCEIDRIAEGCTGVKRSTGQHPGGIIVLPHEHEIYEFTAIQHPANDMNTDIITTHFEYHSIDHNLLKLDILGHDDPTMIRRLEDLTGVKASGIPLDDGEVMKIFHGTEVLGIKPEDIGGVPLGCLGVPEFGTDFVIQMLMDTHPKCFSDLVRISGLSHGTDVWLGNAKKLIEEGTAEISTAICCRDDIMTYLINMGLEKELSFTIMEFVRKGNGLKAEWEKEMKAHDIPDWYIWSCNKIKYMFPKAHAVAYVMMGWRVAWYKVHKPAAYYAAYFSIRASAFSYETMCRGPERLKRELERIADLPKNEQTKKEQDTVRDGRIALEMYARGFTFLPIDIYKAKARDCRIIDGKIMPPLSCVEGLGDKACEQVEEAAGQGRFTSLDNFRQRTKVSKTVIDKMVELDILKGLPDTDQLTLDDYLSSLE